MPRAPDGHASPYRCGAFVDVPHWRLRPHVESANPCAIASAFRPCRSIQARRILAPSRCFPASGQQCPDASGARCNRVGSCDSFVRAPKRKRPRVLEPEGVRVASGDRGDRSPRCERSVDVGGAEIIPLAAKLQCIAPFARAQACIALGRWQQCSDVEDGGHGNSMVRNVVRKFRRGRRWRTLRALFSFGNKIFTSPTSGGIPAVVRPETAETGVRVDFRWSIVLIARRSFESRL